MLPSNVYSVVLSLEPAAAALVGVIILQEPTDAVRWVAIALLITASIGITISHARVERRALEEGTAETITHFLPGAVDSIGADLVQKTGVITLPTTEQIKLDRQAKETPARRFLSNVEYPSHLGYALGYNSTQATLPLFSRGTAACCRCDLGGFLDQPQPS